MSNYWLDLEKTATVAKPDLSKFKGKFQEAKPFTCNRRIYSGASRDTLELAVTLPDGHFELDEGVELVQPLVGTIGGFVLPIRLEVTIESFTGQHNILRDWLLHITDGVPELANAFVYFKKENRLHEIWVLEGVFPQDIDWDLGTHSIKFTLGHERLKKRKVTGGRGELLA